MTNTKKRLATMWLLLCLITPTLHAAEKSLAERLSTLPDRAALDGLIAATPEPAVKQALQKHAPAIGAALAERAHVQAITKTLDAARGTYEKTNLTPAELMPALGGPSPLFDTLKSVSLADAGLGVKAKRETDPFEQAFYEHLGQLSAVENIVIMHTTAQNAWLAPLAKLKSLKTLRIINQAKLNDEGLALLAPLKQLEVFSFIGTSMTGEPFKDFGIWPNCKQSSYRGSKMNDAGLIALCRAFPNLETISLAHGQFTNVAVAELAKLTKLKGLEIGSTKATPECLASLKSLQLEYLQLGDGLDASAGIAHLPSIATLKRLTLTQCQKTTDDDLKTVASLKSLEHLEISGLPLSVERMTVLKQFAFLKSMRIINPRAPYDEATRAAIQAAVPQTTLTFQ